MNVKSFRRVIGGILLAAVATLAASDGDAADERHSDLVVFKIDNRRGADPAIDYAGLERYGPWDDRNYKLKQSDLELLSPNEADAGDALPAFFRVQLRREFPSLPRSGKAQYPRSALNKFFIQHGGFEIDGRRHTRLRKGGSGRFEIVASDVQAEERRPTPKFLQGSEVRVTSPIGNDDAEAAIAINPVNANIVIAGTNGRIGQGQRMWHSTDGGATWLGPVTLPMTCCDPTVGWSPDGSVGYAAALSAYSGEVFFYRSTDGGATWTRSAVVTDENAGYADKEYIHVDVDPASPNYGNVYLSWHEGNVQKFKHSSDGGRTWPRWATTLDSQSRGLGSDMTSDRNGNLYYFFPTLTAGANAHQIRMLKRPVNKDFSAPTTVGTINADFTFPIPAMETRQACIYVSADTDRTGGPYANSVYVSWTDATAVESDSDPAANHAVVKVAYSRDGGATWSISSPHPSGDVASVDRFNQALSVDAYGRVFVVYYDTRHSAGRTGTDLYFSYSADGAQTWSTPQRLTAVTSRNIDEVFEWGDYNGLDVLLKNVIAIYTDNRDEGGGSAESVDVYAKAGFSPNVPPRVDFTAVDSQLMVAFQDLSTDPDGSVVSRLWNFGDGTTSSQAAVTKTYAAPGTYPATLIATDNTGAIGSRTVNVTVDAQVPSAPATVTVPATDVDGGFSIAWSGSTYATSYHVWRSVDGGAFAYLADVAGTSLAVTGQPPGNLKYGVQACNYYCSGQRESDTVAVGVPTAPLLSVANAGCYGQNNASWTAPEGALSYELYVGGSSPANASKLWSGSERGYALNVGATSYVWVKACAAGGCGAFSNRGIATRRPYCD